MANRSAPRRLLFNSPQIGATSRTTKQSPPSPFEDPALGLIGVFSCYTLFFMAMRTCVSIEEITEFDAAVGTFEYDHVSESLSCCFFAACFGHARLSEDVTEAEPMRGLAEPGS